VTGAFLISGDWHLAPGSPASHGRLASAFLARALAAGDTVVLNGDVFDELFSGPGRAEAAHPRVAGEMARLAAAGRLLRTSGNHDPRAGEDRLLLDVPGLGRVLVAHGHRVDPISCSPLGRLGDRISGRFGRHPLVRAAARLAEVSVRGLAGERILTVFRRRCLALTARERAVLGVFGHVHAAHLVAGDRYANAGALGADALSYLVLEGPRPRLAVLREEDLAATERTAESNPPE
jgi:UDP-2,3-diacylglucosamine pyrophosphatase LpxH